MQIRGGGEKRRKECKIQMAELFTGYEKYLTIFNANGNMNKNYNQTIRNLRERQIHKNIHNVRNFLNCRLYVTVYN